MAEKKELPPGQRLADGELRARGIDPQDPERAYSREELASVPPGRAEAKEAVKDLKEGEG
jgi:hypothetical protein